jgi:hypothetical protein
MKQLIDTSYLRKPELEAELQATSSEDQFVLADTAVLETMKNEHWELTARQSFEIISRYPRNIFSATEPSKLIVEELESGKDTEDVVDEYLTKNFRQLLGEIASGVDGPALTYIRSTIAAAQATLAQQQLNHPQKLASLKAAFESVKNYVSREDYKGLSSDELKRDYRLRYAKTLAVFGTQNAAREEGKDSTIGDALSSGRGFIIRQQIGYTLLGFKWFVKRGLDSFPEKKATNEMMDLDHAVTSTYCDRILSKESWLAVMRQDILDALDLAPFSADELRRGQNTLTEPAAA